MSILDPPSSTFPWGHSRRYNSYSEYIKKLFGGRIQKVAVDAGFTCPNRDGSKGSGGCTYCNNNAFNPSYCDPIKPIRQQIEEGIEFHARRYRRAKRFLVYFQPFSNTYAPLHVLKEKFEEALSFPDVAGLVIGTRPDCVDEEKLEYLSRLAEKWYIQVEYGVETHCNATLERINRGHSAEVAEAMIRKTHDYGIHTGAHYIFGLPGEDIDEMFRTGEKISTLPLDSVKFHQLQIVKGTRMAKEFIEKPKDCHSFTLENYIDFIIRFIEKLNPAIVIERFTSEMPPRFLEGPNLGLIRYDEVLRRIEAELEKRDTWQGKYYA
ncbi:MAG: TIGR01212 family radical SAM protein [Bacteroidetes bacterium]|nr:TIGR01212 family radical SAM protein [Bacteroidota bacterium]